MENSEVSAMDRITNRDIRERNGNWTICCSEWTRASSSGLDTKKGWKKGDPQKIYILEVDGVKGETDLKE